MQRERHWCRAPLGRLTAEEADVLRQGEQVLAVSGRFLRADPRGWLRVHLHDPWLLVCLARLWVLGLLVRALALPPTDGA